MEGSGGGAGPQGGRPAEKNPLAFFFFLWAKRPGGCSGNKGRQRRALPLADEAGQGGEERRLPHAAVGSAPHTCSASLGRRRLHSAVRLHSSAMKDEQPTLNNQQPSKQRQWQRKRLHPPRPPSPPLGQHEGFVISSVKATASTTRNVTLLGIKN